MPNDVITLLSNDHDEVEALFRRLESGEAQGAERAVAISTIIAELSMHAVAEEIVLYPMMREALPDGDRQVEKALAEHQSIKDRLAVLDQKDPDDPLAIETVASVAEAVRHHVSEEEGELFTQLRAAVSEGERARLGDRVEKAKKIAPTHPHPLAPNTPPGNLIVGPPTALFDRLRDALVGS